MKTFPEIIKAFGSIVDFAEAVGINYSTARTMSARKSIASHYWRKIIKAAEKEGVSGITLEVMAKISERRARKRK